MKQMLMLTSMIFILVCSAFAQRINLGETVQWRFFDGTGREISMRKFDPYFNPNAVETYRPVYLVPAPQITIPAAGGCASYYGIKLYFRPLPNIDPSCQLLAVRAAIQCVAWNHDPTYNVMRLVLGFANQAQFTQPILIATRQRSECWAWPVEWPFDPPLQMFMIQPLELPYGPYQ